MIESIVNFIQRDLPCCAESSGRDLKSHLCLRGRLNIFMFNQVNMGRVQPWPDRSFGT